DIGNSEASVGDVQSQLRRYRNQFMLHVVWREVFGVASLDETLASLSLLADRLLDAACQYAEKSLLPRYGVVRDAAGSKVPLVVLGMGKLGGRELNFSSDIDLIFLYPEAGDTDGPKKVSAQEYFGRMTRQVIALLDETTVDGFVFRIDTRLRPFGDSGPPVVSFGALESYLLQHGRDWERYAYVKARIVGPHPGDAIAGELYRDLIQPFVYRRYIDFGVFESLREMHAMIAAEVKRRELQDNVKLGPGGIREAEFIVQSLQLVRGGSEPALQSRELQKVLPLLVNNRGLSEEGAHGLREAYRFMRRLENFIQAIRDRQTHELPADEADRARLCLAMGCPDWKSLSTAIDVHRSVISSQFEEVAFRESSAETPLRKLVERAWSTGADEAAWGALLEQEGVGNADKIAKALFDFANDTATRQIDTSSTERLQRFIPLLVSEVVQSERPLRAVTRTLSIVERILRRSAYLALLNENSGALARLVDLCARSHYIADQIARYPVLLDELLDPRLYSEAVTKDELAAELAERLAGDDADSEACMKIIGQFHRSMMFRIAVADFNGQLPIMKVSDGLTWLAEAVLEEVLRVAWRDLAERHGVPTYRANDVRHEAGFGIIAYGKLGGLELSYGSDLDIVFLHDSTGTKQMTDGDKPLDNALFFSRLVRRLVHFLTTQTGSGQLYEIDTRLRPDGGKGLLVTSTDAFERYQEENAWTWEHQALLRARAVAGSAAVAAEFERIRRETLIGRVRRDQLRDDVVSMRQRMRKELDGSNRSRFDLKHGRGGIGDIEFLVQYLVLDRAQEKPDVIFYSDNIRQLDALTAAGCIDQSVGDALQDAYRDYRLRQHHLVLDDQPPLVAVDEFEEQRAFVAKTWDDWLG
ncbi:MAG: bifunctional [glutamate--ammonia ligase]-adenylyl-L-tyrosine phosphorylase/[glutamate--ammonia-ligase] adenylyltransferase, partial [Gammaproteobacteria bacterium]|nr:bifunctional [glutamate--ammonia ligase]-adenylyl-L-tyrosine phosphorylase/[glutamate--ammonia-ligase] adenylyltransferase [Gammaproteobacteria bacterium]